MEGRKGVQTICARTWPSQILPRMSRPMFLSMSSVLRRVSAELRCGGRGWSAPRDAASTAGELVAGGRHTV
jgi:hypothetical protein